MNNNIRKVGKKTKIVVLSIAAISVLMVCGTMSVMAQPPFGVCTYWGTATLDGVPLTAANPDVISLDIARIGYTTTYTMGSDPAYGDNYVLKVDVYAAAADGPIQGDTAIISINGIPINEGQQAIGAAFANVNLGISATTLAPPAAVPLLQPPAIIALAGILGILAIAVIIKKKTRR